VAQDKSPRIGDQARPDPYAAMRTRAYAAVLVLAAALGVPLAAGAYGFLVAVHRLQDLLYDDLPRGLGFDGEPLWWPLPLLSVAGLLVALTIRYLPGTGGHEPADGFQPGGAPSAGELPGILLASLASLALGAVIGPEAPLIALGGGAALLVVRLLFAGLLRREMDARARQVVGASGSFAAISTLLGSPLLGAFLLMEASGLGGPALGIALLPGLLASGIGALVFVGLDNWTGLQTDSLTIPALPPVHSPTVAEFGWALVIGLAAAVAGAGVRRLARLLRDQVVRRRVLLSPLAGLAVAGLAIAYQQGSDRPSSEVLFSGQTTVGPLIAGATGYPAGTLLLLLACKALAYCACLAAFRGGPIFPAMFLGAAGGLAFAHLPGLADTPGAAMGMGALAVVMLRLPMTSVLLATLLLGKPGLTVMPLVIVAVVVSHVASVRMARPPSPGQVSGSGLGTGR
jgi:H+/Cl- antiporter ClcA